jgi:hypothetical protein
VPGEVSVGGGRKPERVGEGVGSAVASGVGERVGSGEAVAETVGDAVSSTVGVGNVESKTGGDWNVGVATAFSETSQARATANDTRKASSLAVRKYVRTIRTGLEMNDR